MGFLVKKISVLFLLSIVLSCNTSTTKTDSLNKASKDTLKKKSNFNSNAKVKEYDYFNYIQYADFPYKMIVNKNTVEIPVCKTILDQKEENVIEVDFGGNIFIKKEKEWTEKQLEGIQVSNAKELSEKYNIWAKIIQKDDYLLDKVDELRGGLPPDKPCLFYNETPTYYIYLNKAKDTTWTLIEATKDSKRVDMLIGL